ncbi:MAG: tail fiber domain-containing protein [Phycisphaerales bacterium]|nr:tail fiber domain-containing protein [Phycisphaerales bacterium]
MRAVSKMLRSVSVAAVLGLCGSALLPVVAQAQTWNYQGVLKQNNTPYNGTADVRLQLWSTDAGGQALGNPQTFSNVTVTDGVFTVSPTISIQDIAYNPILTPFIQVEVRTPSGVGNFAPITPRTPLGIAPKSMWSAASLLPWVASDTTFQRISFNGNFVGIGRSTPITGADKFSIEGNTPFYFGMYVRQASDSGLSFIGYSQGTTQPMTAWTEFDGDRWGVWNGSAHLNVLRNGNVGIGTLSPQSKLDILSNGPMLRFSATDHAYAEWYLSNFGARSAWFGYGSPGDTTFRLQNETGGNIVLSGGSQSRLGINTDNPNYTVHVTGFSGASIGLQTTTGTNVSTWVLQANSNNFSIRNPFFGGTGRLDISSGSRNIVLTGTVSINTSAISDYCLELPNNNDNSGRGRANRWDTYSSARWKSNIQTLHDPLATLNKLRGVSFDWSATGSHDVGFIAEEVAQVMPEIVSTQDGKPVAMDYSRVVPLTVEAIKVLRGENEALKKELEERDARLRRLEERLEKLESK